MLKIDKVTYSYGRRKPKVLDDFSLELSPGSIYGLLGPNGAGKSTLLYLTMGALKPSAGYITYNGDNTMLRLPRTLTGIFLVPEEVTLPPVTLRRYTQLNAPFYPNFSTEVMERCLKAFGLTNDMRLDRISMGLKKKAFISFAFACLTPVLLMDEPTNGLDIPGKVTFRRLCSELMTDDRIMVISTHQVRDLDQLLDRVVMMNENRIIISRSIAEIQNTLRFDRGVPESMARRALAAIPSPGGFDVMMPATPGDETEVNLELLFDYAMHHPGELESMFIIKDTEK